MNRQKIFLLITIIFWIGVGVIVARVNLFWPSPVTFRWNNLHQSSAMFRWQKAPPAGKLILPANTSTSFLVVVPRRFSLGTIAVSTVRGDGTITIAAPARVGMGDFTTTVTAGQTGKLDVDWKTLAVATRTFKVTLTSSDTSVQVQQINLTLTP